MAFEDSGLTGELIIPESVTSIESSAFYNCDNLTKATVNANGTIGSSAFYDCDALETLVLGDGVTEIGSEMCYSCDSLANITFGKYITTIPESAFRLLPSLTSVTLPRFCTTIESNAFAENTKLTAAYVPVTVSSIETDSFSYPARMTMYGKSGSYAEEYADGRSIAFVATDAPITSISYADNAMSIGNGKTVRPTLNIEPSFDTSVVTFTSSDESVLSVSDTGAVYGNDYGTATITATSDSGKSASIKITVVNAAYALELDKTSLSLVTGDSDTLTVSVSPDDAADVLSWSSSNEAVATVDENGLVTACGKGSAVITVTAEYGKVSASCAVTVTEPAELTAFTVDGTTATVTAENVTSASAVYIAAYAANGALVELHKVTMSAGTATAEFSADNIAKYKAFIWNAATQKPMTECGEVSL